MTDIDGVQAAFAALGEVVNVFGSESNEEDAECRQMALYALLTRTLLAEVMTGMMDGKSFREAVITARCYRSTDTPQASLH